MCAIGVREQKHTVSNIFKSLVLRNYPTSVGGKRLCEYKWEEGKRRKKEQSLHRNIIWGAFKGGSNNREKYVT